MNTKLNLKLRVVLGAAATLASVAMTGCGLGILPSTAGSGTGGSTGTSTKAPMITGSVHGGRQAIKFATVYLYKASTTGYGNASTNILQVLSTSAGYYAGGATGCTGSCYANVTTDTNGSFNISSDYVTGTPCVPGDQLYIVTTGGDTGYGGTNAQAVLMAGLGDCTAVYNANRNIQLNEVTTVGTVFALAPFMHTMGAGVTPYAQVGTSSSNKTGLVRAFANVNKLINTGTGFAGGSALPTNATAPTDLLYALGDIIAACVNSTGGVAGDGTTNCGKLFSYANPSGGTAAVDTVGLALAMAQNPTQNVATIFNGYVGSTSPPYTTGLSSPPNDWTMSVKYTGFNAPASVSVDLSGNIWVANSTANSVTVVSQAGVSGTPLTDSSLSTPNAIAIDASGKGWITNGGSSGTNGVTVLTSTGTNSGTYTTGSNPVAIVFDSSNDAWISNYALGATGNGSITELNSGGGNIQTISGLSSPNAVIINAK